jgi:hypothetical protein
MGPLDLKPLKGYLIPPRPQGLQPAGALTPDGFSQNQTNNHHPCALVLKPLKECSTPPQVQGLLSGIDSRHTQSRALIACQLLSRPRLRAGFLLAQAPMTSSKRPTLAPIGNDLRLTQPLQRKHGSADPFAYFRLA